MEKHEKQLNDLKEKLEKAKTLKYKAEARLEQLNKQQEEIINELNDLGVKPEELENEIEKLDQEIRNLIEEANKLLPSEILK
ncbi:hypothetical protein [Caldisalinibacter kiritimatiensis]|uniref:Viral A-type inclusion protein n=1 Tax=Caldisalinibacter kiritimatiensis TaxID=1304284 RepID=R1CNC3_9FIRM|nr:hypothetical protein [Caldisalinibacter kiritimatiensis]EOD00211.1 hypothetical protein L21TH_1756 [Caldisalinibacter kiritimatiensis]